MLTYEDEYFRYNEYTKDEIIAIVDLNFIESHVEEGINQIKERVETAIDGDIIEIKFLGSESTNTYEVNSSGNFVSKIRIYDICSKCGNIYNVEQNKFHNCH